MLHVELSTIMEGLLRLSCRPACREHDVNTCYTPIYPEKQTDGSATPENGQLQAPAPKELFPMTTAVGQLTRAVHKSPNGVFSTIPWTFCGFLPIKVFLGLATKF